MKKRTIIFLSIFSITSVWATDIQLAWDASPTSNVTYIIYGTTNMMSSTNLHSSQIKLDVGTNQTVLIRDMKPAMWTFAATAARATVNTNFQTLILGQPTLITNTIESDPSNFLMLEMPQPPANMRTLVIQVNATLVGTNWFDAGFFKLKIMP